MIKYKKPAEPHEAATAKKPEIGSMLLRTYMTSLLCLVLCVSMFFGTSYAWFTSEVNNTGNEIYIGVLDVELEKRIGNTEWGSLSTTTTEGAHVNNLYSKSVLWEPGYTSRETIRVHNKGSLAFSYALSFTDGEVKDRAETIVVDGKPVTDNFDVWVYSYRANNNAEPSVVEYSSIVKEGSGWTFAGSLTDVLAGKVVLSGTMETEGEEALYTIAVHMKETADTSVMGHKISMNVKLIAYQTVTDENARYDQMVATAEELQAAFQKGGSVALAADITAKDVQTLATVPEGKSVDLYLNGHNITANLVTQGSDPAQLFYVDSGAKLTIHGDTNNGEVFVDAPKAEPFSAVIRNCGGTVEINGGRYSLKYDNTVNTGSRPVFVDNIGANLIINNGAFYGINNEEIYNHKSGTGTLGTVEINGGTFTKSVVRTEIDNGNPVGVTVADEGEVTLEWNTDGVAVIKPAPVTGE